MKILTMYLPQFHRVPENDVWWGDGFTDWVSAKSAKPLYAGHYQPHIPMNHNYYDILQKTTMIWQAELMEKYGIDGQCIYHYWFKNGRKILEKPAENLLKWKDINIPFCFCWANETWADSWSVCRNALVWTHNDNSQNPKGILLKQQYGTEEDWIEHFHYLLPFFEDERYIKIDGKPIFIFYKTADIHCINEMGMCWNNLARENGFPGIYTIGAYTDKPSESALDAVLFHETNYSRMELLDKMQKSGIKKLSYDEIWSRILNNSGRRDKRTFFGGFVSYDDTPRRGVNGIVVDGCTPEKFGHYLTKLLTKNANAGNEYTFINAWNEWGEGMHLEPDEKYGDAFLKQIKMAKKNYVKENNNDFSTNNETIDYWRWKADKFELYLNDLDYWMCLREQGKKIEKALKQRGIQSLLIYGFGILGRHLLTELENANTIEVKGIIDQKKEDLKTNIPIFDPEDSLPKADAIVVSSYYFLNEIKNRYIDKNINLVSLRTILYEM